MGIAKPVDGTLARGLGFAAVLKGRSLGVLRVQLILGILVPDICLTSDIVGCYYYYDLCVYM